MSYYKQVACIAVLWLLADATSPPAYAQTNETLSPAMVNLISLVSRIIVGWLVFIGVRKALRTLQEVRRERRLTAYLLGRVDESG